MAQLKKKTFEISPAQDAFLKRKKEEIRRLVPEGQEDRVTESTVIQGLIDMWMALDARKDASGASHKVNARKSNLE